MSEPDVDQWIPCRVSFRTEAVDQANLETRAAACSVDDADLGSVQFAGPIVRRQLQSRHLVGLVRDKGELEPGKMIGDIRAQGHLHPVRFGGGLT